MVDVENLSVREKWQVVWFFFDYLNEGRVTSGKKRVIWKLDPEHRDYKVTIIISGKGE